MPSRAAATSSRHAGLRFAIDAFDDVAGTPARHSPHAHAATRRACLSSTVLTRRPPPRGAAFHARRVASAEDDDDAHRRRAGIQMSGRFRRCAERPRARSQTAPYLLFQAIRARAFRTRGDDAVSRRRLRSWDDAAERLADAALMTLANVNDIGQRHDDARRASNYCLSPNKYTARHIPVNTKF